MILNDFSSVWSSRWIRFPAWMINHPLGNSGIMSNRCNMINTSRIMSLMIRFHRIVFIILHFSIIQTKTRKVFPPGLSKWCETNISVIRSKLLLTPGICRNSNDSCTSQHIGVLLPSPFFHNVAGIRVLNVLCIRSEWPQNRHDSDRYNGRDGREEEDLVRDNRDQGMDVDRDILL